MSDASSGLAKQRNNERMQYKFQIWSQVIVWSIRLWILNVSTVDPRIATRFEDLLRCM